MFISSSIVYKLLEQNEKLQNTIIDLTEQNKELQISLNNLIDRYFHNYVPEKYRTEIEKSDIEEVDSGYDDNIGDAYSLAILDAKRRAKEILGESDDI